MSLVQRALDKPISVSMFFAALVLLGLISLHFLPLDLMPEVAYPVLTVSTRLGGYSPPEIEQTLTKPMEASLASLNKLVRLRSYSREGESEFRLAFEVGTDMDFVIHEVRERLNQLTPQLPTDTKTPRLTKYDPASAPVMVVSLFGTLDPVSLRLVGEELIKKNLNRVPGVSHIEVYGGQRPEVIIEPQLDRLRALGLSILNLTEMLKDNNLELALGAVDQGAYRIPVRSLGSFRNLDDIRRLGVLRTLSGSLIQLQQVAQVSFGSQDQEVISHYQGEPRVMVTIQREYGAHIVEVSRSLRAALGRLQPQLPSGVN